MKVTGNDLIALRWFFIFVAVVVPPLVLFAYPIEVPFVGIDIARVVSWVICLIGIAAVFVQAGFELQGRACGVLIDERNRFSLSRLQMTLWSVLVLSSLYVVLISNIFRAKSGEDPLSVVMNWNLMFLMGMSVGTFVTAPLALSLKNDKPADRTEAVSVSQHLKDTQELTETPTVSGTVMVKKSSRDARLADLIRGEEIGNARVVDITRTQMLIITVIVVIAYSIDIWEQVAFAYAPIMQFPELGETVLGLIFISHAGYLVGKLSPTLRGEAGTGSTKNLARALQASQRATDLVRNIELQLSTLPAGGNAKMLQDTLILARSAAAQASVLPTRVTEPNFKEDELANIEGRIEMLLANVSSWTGLVPTSEMANSPAASKVLEVQRLLRDQGRTDVLETGIPDAQTDSAIVDALKAIGVDRKDLHPHIFRFYEEAVQILVLNK